MSSRLDVAAHSPRPSQRKKNEVAGPVYRVSASGRQALQSKDLSVPSDYRTILWIMEFQGSDHLQPLMRLFPQEFLSDCLAEMEELHLIEPVAMPDGGATAPASAPSGAAELHSIATHDLVAARDSLSQHGAYLSEERLEARRGLAKTPSETAVLVVEDDPDQLALADLRLSMAGYKVRAARSQAALLKSMATEGIPDLILLNVTLPDGDGFDILARLRRLPSFAKLAIVMLTSRTSPDDIAKGLTLGADGYITKPYSKNILASTIQRVLRTA